MEKKKKGIFTVLIAIAVLLIIGGVVLAFYFGSTYKKESPYRGEVFREDFTFTNFLEIDRGLFLVSKESTSKEEKKYLLDQQGTIIDVISQSLHAFADQYYYVGEFDNWSEDGTRVPAVVQIRRNGKEVYQSDYPISIQDVELKCIDGYCLPTYPPFEVYEMENDLLYVGFEEEFGLVYAYRKGSSQVLQKYENAHLYPVWIDQKKSDRYLVLATKGEQVTYQVLDTKENKVVLSSMELLRGQKSFELENGLSLDVNHNIIAQKGGKFGLFSLQEELIAPQYDQLISTGEKEYYIASKEGKFGIINLKNEIVVPFQYNYIDHFGSYLVLLQQGTLSIMDAQLKMLHENVMFNLLPPTVFSYDLLSGMQGGQTNFSTIGNDLEVSVMSKEGIVKRYFSPTEEISAEGKNFVRIDDTYFLLGEKKGEHFVYSVYENGKQLVTLTPLFETEVYDAQLLPNGLVYINQAYYSLKTGREVKQSDIFFSLGKNISYKIKEDDQIELYHSEKKKLGTVVAESIATTPFPDLYRIQISGEHTVPLYRFYYCAQ